MALRIPREVRVVTHIQPGSPGIGQTSALLADNISSVNTSNRDPCPDPATLPGENKDPDTRRKPPG